MTYSNQRGIVTYNLLKLRKKQSIDRSIQRFDETMAPHAERTKDRSNLSLHLSNEPIDEGHVPKRIIDLDVESLNDFRDQDPMEEVTLIDTEMARRIEKLVDTCARNTKRYAVETALRPQSRCNSVPNIPNIGNLEDYGNAIVIDVQHPTTPFINFPTESNYEHTVSPSKIQKPTKSKSPSPNKVKFGNLEPRTRPQCFHDQELYP